MSLTINYKYSWQSFKPLSNLNAMTSARAEPDGIENEDHLLRKDSFEGEYDHSKEYDPFQVGHFIWISYSINDNLATFCGKQHPNVHNPSIC